MTDSYPALIELISRLEGKDKKTCELALYCLNKADMRDAKLRAQNEQLRAALKPFADLADLIPETHMADSEIWPDIYEVSLAMPTVGDLRVAKAALRETEHQKGEENGEGS